ncbi:MAG: EFR1 family ferrodoxin [Spirochaetales bacterium]|nr:EFR1 family ferrodoxin [Spirochaetales bacterium]
MKSEVILETSNLTVYYGSQRGIKDLNLSIKKGEIFGFLGPNGAGKTTTLRVVLDIIPILIFIYNKTRYFNLENKFYADINCTGCGICSKICLSGKIKMKDNKPTWNKKIKCIFCFACIHYCPAHAIQIKNGKTIVRGRYHHPEVSAGEIINQKNNSPCHISIFKEK